MTFDSIEFVAFCAAAILVLNVFRGGRIRLLAIVVFNFIFLASFVSSAVEVAPLAGFLVLGYAAIALSARVRPWSLPILVAVVVAIFIWLKQYTIAGFLPHLPFPYLLVGFSYMLFRIVHLMVDVNQGAQKPPALLHYLAYLLFFLSFVSGPIQRHEDFARQTAEPRLPGSLEDVHQAFNRIILGFFLVAVVSQFTFYVFSHLEPRLYAALAGNPAGFKVIILYAATVTAFLVHLYLNFSGYMEMVIGIGMLSGFRLPENFDRPYLSRSFLDFWSRWHITLSEWFKFYVFNPSLKSLAERWGTSVTMPYLGVIAFFVTFLVMGIWHGSTLIYLIYGLFLSFGMAANKLYEVEMNKRLGKTHYRELRARGWYQHLARSLTLAYFAVALTCVWLAPAKVPAMATPVVLAVAVAALVLVTGGIFVLSAAIGSVASLVCRHASRFRTVGDVVVLPWWVAPAWTAAKLFAVVNLALIAGSAPEFVYKVF